MQTLHIVIDKPRSALVLQRELTSDGPGPDELLIRTGYTFISTGTELSIYTAADVRVFEPGSWCSYPHRAGYANAGTVVAAGENVREFAPGDRVFTAGPHASHFICNRGQLILKVPDAIDSRTAAAARMAGVAMTAPLFAPPVFDTLVVVTGLGVVGNCAAQIYRAMGCRVIGVDPVAHRREIAAACGIDAVLDPETDDIAGEIEKRNDGHPADICVESTGMSSVILETHRYVGRKGRIVLLGTPREPFTGEVTGFFQNVQRKNIAVFGAFEHCLPVHGHDREDASMSGKFTKVFGLIGQQRIHLEPLISHTIRPGDIGMAYEGLLNRPDEWTGVAIDWTG